MQGFTNQQGVPLCVRPLKAAQRCQLLNVASMTIAFKGRGPLVPNAGGTGYYRLAGC